MRFLVDAQLPPALAAKLRSMGQEAEHVQDVALRDADDAAVRAYAKRVGAILFTKDRDFVQVDAANQARVPVVWVRIGNVSNEILLRRLESAWPELSQHLVLGAYLVELR